MRPLRTPGDQKERDQIARIKWKMRKGERLTSGEEAAYAYSRYGTANRHG